MTTFLLERPATPLYVVAGYLALLLVFSLVMRRKTTSSADYFVAGRSVGPFLLLMSVFGTTMTAFALVGSTGKAFDKGIGVYGLMASTSGIIHSLVFFLVGIKLWAIGKRHGYMTQIQYFRARFDSNAIGYMLFPILVGLVIPYLLLGILGAGAVMKGVTRGMFPEVFDGGAVPPWVTGLVVCGVVLAYIVAGGVRAAAIANACQTIVFMIVGVLAFYLVSDALGGVEAATQQVIDKRPDLADRTHIGHWQFLTYAFIPLSVGMFPHLFQHWLTARSAKAFRTTVIAHPIFIMIVWVPCVLIGIWAAGMGIESGGNVNTILPKVVGSLLKNPWMTGLLTAGILAAIMSSLDSQFVCLGTIFTHDIVLNRSEAGRYTDRQKVLMGRAFILFIVAVTYTLSLFPPPNIFDLAVWCFSGFASLFPIVFASLYWRRVTRHGAMASIIVTAATWCGLFVHGLSLGELDYLLFGMMPVTIMFALSTATLIIVSLRTRPPPVAVVDRFFGLPNVSK